MGTKGVETHHFRDCSITYVNGRKVATSYHTKYYSCTEYGE